MSGATNEVQKESQASEASSMMVQITTDKSGPKLICPICNKSLVSLNGYIKHMKRHEPPGGFCCNFCDDRFCLDELLKKHKDEKHKILACQICHATFSNADEYRAHIRDVHHGVDRHMYVCEKCGLEFKTAQAHKRHEQTQCGKIKAHVCDECNMAFYTKYNLADHKKIHRGEKKFCCSYCGKSFLSKGRLVIHERSHTGEKPYKCDVCGKCFAHRESIVTHSSIHTGVKLVVCKCCGARFSCHSNLIKHRRTRQDTCGLPMYDSTKEKKRNGNSRIPYSLMSSEIKIVQASKIIDPSEEQKKHKVAKAPRAPKAPKALKARKTLTAQHKKSESDDEKVIIKRPRRSQRTDTLNEIKAVAPVALKSDSESDDGGNDPPFECPTMEESDDSCESDVKPPGLDILLANTPVKKEEEENPIAPLFEKEPSPVNMFVEVKPELVTELKDEDLADIKEEEYPQLKPCRVVLTAIKPPPPKEVINNPKAKRRRAAFRKKLVLFKKDRIYNCQHCIKMYHIRKPYETHLREQHNKTNEEIRAMFADEDNDIPSDLVHRCPICSKVYLMAKRLQTHITYHGPGGDLIHKCPCYCNLYFKTKDEAIDHAKVEHKEALYCEICDKYSLTPESCKIHKRSHSERRKTADRNLICDKCAKSFSTRTTLSDHIRSNCGKNPFYTCEECDKSFTTAGILKTHLLLHKDETPFVCDKCGKAFKVKSQYKTHLKTIHTDNKPFKCNQCPKEYPYRESLLTHMASHTGLKRFACDGCSKRFTCISNLQAHRKVYADSCGLHPLNSKPCLYIGMQKGCLLMGNKPTF